MRIGEDTPRRYLLDMTHRHECHTHELSAAVVNSRRPAHD